MWSSPSSYFSLQSSNVNVVSRLMSRELRGGEHVRRHEHVRSSHAFYLSVYPDFNLINVDKPPCFLRKFSPDGKRFLAFSPTQTHLEVYKYLGASVCNEELRKLDRKANNPSLSVYTKLRKSAFERFFVPEHFIPVVRANHEQLNRECSVFSECGDYVIVGSSIFLSNDCHPPMHELHQNNESVAPNPRNPLEDITLYSIEYAEGVVVDSIHFPTDKIFLSHNQGVCLHQQTLAVLSVQHQTIHIFKFFWGRFMPVGKVGRLLYEDDPFLLSHTLTADQQTRLPRSTRFSTATNSVYRNFREETINLLKHRILVFLYKRAVQSKRPTKELQNFYRHFDHLRSLRMWKMQLLDGVHVLIKYTSEEVVTLRAWEPNAQPTFFVIYNLATTQVLAVFPNTSDELLRLFEHHTDVFRQTNQTSLQTMGDYALRSSQNVSSAANNLYARLNSERFKQSILNAKNGGPVEAKKRVLSQLPISCQSFSGSPYLDLSLFSYDEKWISAMERPKACSDNPIQFFCRQTGQLKFKIIAGLPNENGNSNNNSNAASSRRLVAFIFHPTDPFVISLQKTNLDYVVNFHLRYPS